MRMQPSFFTVILLVLMLSASGIVSAESPGPVDSGISGNTTNISDLLSSEPPGHVVVYFFYSKTCGECQKALTFMEGFRERHPDVIIRSYDLIDNASNRQLFQQFNKRYNVPFSPVPAVFVGEWELTDIENIELHLDDIVVQVAQNPNATPPVPQETIPSPDISGSTRLTIPLVIVAGLVDGINPCAFAVMVFLLVSIMSIGSKKRALKVGIVYIGAVFIFYFLSGLGLFALVQVSGFSTAFAIIAATVAFVAGAIMIKEALSGGSGDWLVIPESKKATINRYIEEATLPAAFVLGILVGMFELPCTGGIYLAIISLISQKMTMMEGLPLLLLYNILFVLPLIIILAIVYFGLPPERLETWRTENRVIVRLAMGCLMIVIGIIVIFSVFYK
ncbi:MAG: cytochrome c biogenesis CcdA family protein [Methanoregulaceae archaeon]|nr:cytochrome c biogenesis CcdA family protein [Methanoregulaceae archaeon]